MVKLHLGNILIETDHIESPERVVPRAVKLFSYRGR